MQTQTRTPEETMELGLALYRETIRPQLTREDFGKFIVVNLDTGEYAMDADDVIAGKRAKERFGVGSNRLMLRAGYIAAVSFGFVGSDYVEEGW